jgi:hypothetical protein
MGQPSYMRSVVDRNVVMLSIPVPSSALNFTPRVLNTRIFKEPYWSIFSTVNMYLIFCVSPLTPQSYGCCVTRYTVITKPNFTSGDSFCWRCCRNVSIVLREDGPLRAATFRSDIVLIKWCFNNVYIYIYVCVCVCWCDTVMLVHGYEQD